MSDDIGQGSSIVSKQSKENVYFLSYYNRNRGVPDDCLGTIDCAVVLYVPSRRMNCTYLAQSHAMQIRTTDVFRWESV